MFNQKGFSKIALIVIVLILIGGAYFVFNKKVKNIPSKTTENQSSQSSQSIGGDLSMSDWKTYKNDQGFEFKYPTDWIYKDVSDANSNAIIALGPKNDFESNILPIFSEGAVKDRGAIWIVDGSGVMGSGQATALSTSIQFFLKNYEPTAKIKEEDIVAGDIKSKLVYVRNQNSNNIDKWVFVPKDDDFVFILGIVSDELLYGEVFSQILSTFKITP